MDEGALVAVYDLRSLLEQSLPLDEVAVAFAYGSGVFAQENIKESSISSTDEPLIDFILVVTDSYRFHQQNLAKNPQHYARPFIFTSDEASRITWWQRHVVDSSHFRNPGVYFNLVDGWKYGVIQVEDLVQDLTDWKYLYIAGRMHKPTLMLIDRQQEQYNKADLFGPVLDHQMTSNIPAAVAASLILLSSPASSGEEEPESIMDHQLFRQISALSYTGDPRMQAGAEDPDKVEKLVHSPGQLKRFHHLYSDSLQQLEEQGVLTLVHYKDEQFSAIEWNHSDPKVHRLLWSHLPKSLSSRVAHLDDPQRAASELQAILPSIVSAAARYQSMKGLISAGVTRSWKYAVRKYSKGLFRR